MPWIKIVFTIITDNSKIEGTRIFNIETLNITTVRKAIHCYVTEECTGKGILHIKWIEAGPNLEHANNLLSFISSILKQYNF